MRLDKWLWAARFFKTRQLAVEAVERHRVQCNGQDCKPSREVRVGDHLQLRQPGWTREVEILGLSMQRGPAPQAQALYRDTPDSLSAAAAAAERRRLAPEPADTLDQGRPTKRDRRRLEEWSGQGDAPTAWERWSAKHEES